MIFNCPGVSVDIGKELIRIRFPLFKPRRWDEGGMHVNSPVKSILTDKIAVTTVSVIYLNIRLRGAHVDCRRNSKHHLCLLMIVRYFGAISKREASSSLMSHGQRESRTARWTDYTWPPDTFGLKTVRLLVPAPVPQIFLFAATLACVREMWHKGNGKLNCEVDGMEGHHNIARS